METFITIRTSIHCCVPVLSLTLESCSIGVIAVPILQLSKRQSQSRLCIYRVEWPVDSVGACGRWFVLSTVPLGFQSSPEHGPWGLVICAADSAIVL